MNKVFYLLFFIALVSAVYQPASAQNLQKPKMIQKAILKKPFEIGMADARRQVADTGMRKSPPYKINFRKFRKFNIPTNRVPETADDAAASEAPQLAEAQMLPSISKPIVWSNYLASTFDEFPFITPPDPVGDVGSTQVVVATNASIKVFPKKTVTEAPFVTTKGGSLKPAPDELFLTLDEFFAPVLSLGASTTDPHVRYDRLTKRWFFTCIDVPNSFFGNNLLLAVSDGEHLTSSTGFFYYSFPLGALFPSASETPAFLDYPTLGIDNNAVLVGGVSFYVGDFFVDSVNFVGMAIDKRRMLQGELWLGGATLGKIDYTTGMGYGMVVPQGVQNDDPATNKSFFAGINMNQNGLALATITYTNDGANLGYTELPVEQFNFPRDVVALGSPMPIDPLDTRLFAAAIHKNKLTGKSSLWTAHAIGVNQMGEYVPDSVFVNQARTASRWYEVSNVYSKPDVHQYGTLFDPSTKTGRRANVYFNPSIMANGQGYALLGGTTAAYNSHLNAFVAGRHHDDPKGTLSEPVKVTSARALYALVYGFYLGRWGDYSQTVVDPDDDQTIWTFQEYANWDDNYGTRAVQIKAPPPATPLPLGTLYNKADTVITITGMSVDHSGFFDPGTDKGGPGYNRLSVKVTDGIIASNIKFKSPTQITCKLNLRNKPEGEYTVVITNPDGQIVTTKFTIAAKPAMSKIAPKAVPVSTTAMRVYPNPTPGDFRLQVQAAQNFAGRVVLLDLGGKQLSEQKFSLVKGNNDIGLSLSQFAAGSYIAVVYDASNNLVGTQVVVKQ